MVQIIFDKSMTLKDIAKLKRKFAALNIGIEGFEILDQTPNEILKKSAIDKLTTVQQNVIKKLKNNILCSQCYGVTFTLQERFNNDDPVWMHKFIEDKIKKSYIWQRLDYMLFPEFTPKNCRLHYHGIIFNCYEKEAVRAIQWWRRTFGFVKPELKLKNKNNWCKYIVKDYTQTGLWTIYNSMFYEVERSKSKRNNVF